MAKYHHGKLKDALLARASEVIRTEGVEGISLSALARDIGVSETAPARHFKSRTDLLQTLAKTGYAQATRAVLGNLDAGPMALPNRMGKAFVAWAKENPQLFATIMHPDVTRHADAELKAALHDFMVAIKTAITSAQAAGWRTDSDPELLFHYALAGIRGLAANASDPLFQDVAGELSDQDIEAVIDLMLPKDNSGE
ncbi:MAG: TetR/AcrR family transcriptional regulator [Pseudomonadota bacterium]